LGFRVRDHGFSTTTSKAGFALFFEARVSIFSVAEGFEIGIERILGRR
jgi:hypothetical protein